MTDNITLPRATVQQALEALEFANVNHWWGSLTIDKAIAALRTALEQQQAEPDRRDLQAAGTHPAPCARHCEAKAFEIEIRSLNSRLEQQAEPVGEVIDERGEVDYISYVPPVGTALYTSPQQQAEPSQWRDMVVVTLVREGVNKHKARELADHFATLFQQQAEPVAWPHKWGCRANAFGECSMGCTTHPAPTQQQAEPVAWMVVNDAGEDELWWHNGSGNGKPLYTAPPQRQWVGLTDEEIDGLRKNFATRPAIKAIEAKLKEKNT